MAPSKNDIYITTIACNSKKVSREYLAGILKDIHQGHRPNIKGQGNIQIVKTGRNAPKTRKTRKRSMRQCLSCCLDKEINAKGRCQPCYRKFHKEQKEKAAARAKRCHDREQKKQEAMRRRNQEMEAQNQENDIDEEMEVQEEENSSISSDDFLSDSSRRRTRPFSDQFPHLRPRLFVTFAELPENSPSVPSTQFPLNSPNDSSAESSSNSSNPQSSSVDQGSEPTPRLHPRFVKNKKIGVRPKVAPENQENPDSTVNFPPEQNTEPMFETDNQENVPENETITNAAPENETENEEIANAAPENVNQENEAENEENVNADEPENEAIVNEAPENADNDDDIQIWHTGTAEDPILIDED